MDYILMIHFTFIIFMSCQSKSSTVYKKKQIKTELWRIKNPRLERHSASLRP